MGEDVVLLSGSKYSYKTAILLKCSITQDSTGISSMIALLKGSCLPFVVISCVGKCGIVPMSVAWLFSYTNWQLLHTNLDLVLWLMRPQVSSHRVGVFDISYFISSFSSDPKPTCVHKALWAQKQSSQTLNKLLWRATAFLKHYFTVS